MIRNYILGNFPFLEDDFDALTDYQLFCKMLAYMKKVSVKVDDFEIKLNKYENYFNNLDVQEEIDNKLDEMLESGELASIISDFLALKSTYTFNNVAEMKLSQSFINGTYAKTLGYYNINDGGESYYYVRNKTNDDVIDDIFIVSLYDTDLVAELLLKNNLINVKQAGITGDENDDNTSLLSIVFNKGCDMYFPSGIYNVSSLLTFKAHKIIGDNSSDSIIKYAGESNNVLLTSNNLSDVKIKDIGFDLGELQDNLISHINLINTTGLKILNCEIKGGYGTQLRLNGSSNVLIGNSNFHDVTGASGNPGECIYCNGIIDLTVDKCVCNNVQDHFLYLDGSTPVNNVIINNCDLKYTGKENVLTNGASIAIYGNSKNIFISNNKISYCKNGINSDIRDDVLPSNIFLKDNAIFNNTQDGCFLTGINLKIHNNLVYSNGQDGFNIRNSSNVNLNNNSVYSNTRNGIASRNTSYVNINNNEIYNNTTSGVTLGTDGNPCNHVYMNSCNIYKTDDGTQGTGLQLLYGDDYTILNCKSYGNTLNYDTRRATTTNVCVLLNGTRYDSNINSIEYSDDIPSNGSYKRGDIILYNSPSADGYIGAVCTTTGAPGTWKQFGKINA